MSASAAATPPPIDLYYDAYWAVAGGIVCTPIGIEGVRTDRAAKLRRAKVAEIRSHLVPLLGEAALADVEQRVAEDTHSVSYVGCPTVKEEAAKRRSVLSAIRRLNRYVDSKVEKGK